MPTRLPVLLQRRKSAAAGCAKATIPIKAITAGSNARVTPPRRIGNRSKSTSVWPGALTKAGFSREDSGRVNEDGPEVINIGEGRSGHQKVPERGEELGGVVVGQKRGRIEAKGAGARRRGTIAESSGRVGGRAGAAVGAVGISRQDADATDTRERDGERQGVFLIGSALAAMLVQRHCQLAAGQNHGAAALRLQFAGDAGMLLCH